MKDDSSNLTLSKLVAIETDLRKLGPVLQAIAVYDCEATKEQVITIEYKADVLSFAQTFGMEAGPLVRWFFEEKPFTSLDALFEYDVVPINQYGFAAVMSQATWEKFESLMKKDDIQDTVRMILQPRVYFLNGDER